MGLQLVITDAGRAAVVDHAGGGFRAVRVAAVGLSATAVDATARTVALPGEIKRIATIAGETTAPDTFHVTVTDESSDDYTVRSFALYLADGTLFALYGQAEVIVEKSPQALLLLAVDVILVDVPAASITFGDASFTNPAATTERAGVVKLATQVQASAGSDDRRALSPATAKGALLSWLGFVPVQQGTGIDQEPYTVKIGWSKYGLLATVDTYALGSFAFDRPGNPVFRLSNGGSGSGFDADLLDGHHGNWYADIPARLGFVPVQQGTGIDQEPYTVKIGWSKHGLLATVDNYALGSFAFDRPGDPVFRISNGGSGSGFDADMLDGQHGTYYTDIPARLGFVPVQQATGIDQEPYTVKIGWSKRRLVATVDNYALGAFAFDRAGDPVFHLSTGGSGSGFDADMLDGQHGTYYTDIPARLGFVPVQQATGIDQEPYTVKIGWSKYGLLATVDTYALGSFTFDRPGDPVWRLSRCGSGSGLDADLLDGLDATAFARAAHLHSATDLAGAFPGSLAGNGYTTLPNGLILQWLTAGAGTTEGTVAVTWPIAFPHACLNVVVGVQASAGVIDGDVFFQLASEPSTTGATLMRQGTGAWNAAVTATARLLAIGY